MKHGNKNNQYVLFGESVSACIEIGDKTILIVNQNPKQRDIWHILTNGIGFTI